MEKPKGSNNPRTKEASDIGKTVHKEFAEKEKEKEKRWKSNPSLIDPKTGKTVKPDGLRIGLSKVCQPWECFVER